MGLQRDVLIGLGILGFVLVILGVVVGLIFLLTKAIGILIILVGIFLIFFFPGEAEAQPHEMSRTGIVIGIILAIVGIVVLVAL